MTDRAQMEWDMLNDKKLEEVTPSLEHLLHLRREVKRMRELQKAYFKSRSRDVMLECMIHEKAVDALLNISPEDYVQHMAKSADER